MQNSIGPFTFHANKVLENQIFKKAKQFFAFSYLKNCFVHFLNTLFKNLNPKQNFKGAMSRYGRLRSSLMISRERTFSFAIKTVAALFLCCEDLRFSAVSSSPLIWWNQNCQFNWEVSFNTFAVSGHEFAFAILLRSIASSSFAQAIMVLLIIIFCCRYILGS